MNTYHRTDVGCKYTTPSLPEILASDAINIARKSGAPAQLRRKPPVQATIILGAHAMTVAVDKSVHSRGDVHAATAEPEAVRALSVSTAAMSVPAHLALSTEPEAAAYHRACRGCAQTPTRGCHVTHASP